MCNIVMDVLVLHRGPIEIGFYCLGGGLNSTSAPRKVEHVIHTLPSHEDSLLCIAWNHAIKIHP